MVGLLIAVFLSILCGSYSSIVLLRSDRPSRHKNDEAAALAILPHRDSFPDNAIIVDLTGNSFVV
jgi:hypothetical protein